MREVDVSTMRRLVSVVGIVSLVLLAGCGGGFGFDTGTDISKTVTPVRVPTDDPLSNLPTGLSEEGVTNSSALADAHTEAFVNTSFTLQSNRTLVASNGTRLIDTSSVWRVGANHNCWTTERAFNGTYAWIARAPVENVNINSVSTWHNRKHEFYQLQRPNGTEYRIYATDSGVDPTGRQQLLSYYRHAESTTVSTANGRIRLSMSIGPEIRMGSQLAVNVTERTVILTLTETGRVERYRYEYIGRLSNDPNTAVKGVRVARFTGVGETSPERPDWVTTARNTTTGRISVTVN